MKKLIIVALGAIALASCGERRAAENQNGNNVERTVETVYDIAYVNIDSLINNYAKYMDLSAEFEVKANKAQTDLETKARKLQNEMLDYQEKVQKGLITRSQAAQLQETLETKANDFETQRQNKLQELGEEEQVLTNQVLDAIRTYIAKFNADYRYKIIISTSAMSPVLHADPALNITKEVLDGLNADYAAQNTKNSKK